MKITKTQLRQIIKEEVSRVLGTINENMGIGTGDLLEMARKLYMRTGRMAFDIGQPHGQVLANMITKELKKKGLEDSQIQAALKFLEGQEEDELVKNALTKEMR